MRTTTNEDYRRELDRLRDRGVGFVILRGDEHLVAGNERLRDLDLLVAEGDVPAFRDLMEERGFWIWEYSQPHQEMWTTLTLPGLRSLTLDRKPGLFPPGLSLDAPPAREVVGRAEAGPGGHPVPCPTHRFWSLYTHVVVNREPEEREAYLPRLRALSEGGRVEDLEGRMSAATALGWVLAPRGEILEALGATYRPPYRKRIPRRGLTVAVVGPDGSGKSTLIGLLEGVLPYASRVYMGLREFVLPTTRWLYRRAGGGTGGGASQTRPDHATWAPGGGTGDGERAGRRAGTHLRYGLYLLNHHLELLAKYVKGRVLALRGRIVLFDRYHYDVMGLPCDSFEARLRPFLLRSFPRPDLLVFLRPPLDALLERKQERTRKYYESYFQAYGELLKAISPDVPVLTLETLEEPEATARTVAIRIQRMRQPRAREELP